MCGYTTTWYRIALNGTGVPGTITAQRLAVLAFTGTMLPVLVRAPEQYVVSVPRVPVLKLVYKHVCTW